MEQDFQHCIILSCCHAPLVMHAYRCEMSGVIMQKTRICIFVREEHWAATETMHNHGRSFIMEILNHLS
jgi:hypothetical protein